MYDFEGGENNMIEKYLRKVFLGSIAYFILNIKSLLIEKLSFVWSITVPLLVYYVNKEDINSAKDLSFYWCYMIVSSYLFGLGIYAVEMRESGCLKTIFSINNSKMAYILGNIFTQLTYTLICISIFNIYVMIDTEYAFLEMEKNALILMLLCFPIGIGSYGFTLVKIFYVNSLKTLGTILLFVGLMITGSNYRINAVNYLFIVPKILFGDSTYYNTYLLMTIFLLCVGFIGINCFGPISRERR